MHRTSPLCFTVSKVFLLLCYATGSSICSQRHSLFPAFQPVPLGLDIHTFPYISFFAQLTCSSPFVLRSNRTDLVSPPTNISSSAVPLFPSCWQVPGPYLQLCSIILSLGLGCIALYCRVFSITFYLRLYFTTGSLALLALEC